jgi:hypothetical protein
MTKQITYTRTLLGFYNIRHAGNTDIIATLSPTALAKVIGQVPVGQIGTAEVEVSVLCA